MFIEVGLRLSAKTCELIRLEHSYEDLSLFLLPLIIASGYDFLSPL